MGSSRLSWECSTLPAAQESPSILKEHRYCRAVPFMKGCYVHGPTERYIVRPAQACSDSSFFMNCRGCFTPQRTSLFICAVHSHPGICQGAAHRIPQGEIPTSSRTPCSRERVWNSCLQIGERKPAALTAHTPEFLPRADAKRDIMVFNVHGRAAISRVKWFLASFRR
jgi:hypothetical protein